MIEAVGVIPARYGSTRFPGKPLTMIAGRPMIQRVIEGARKSRRVKRLIVATDNSEIAQVAERADCEFVLTDSDLPTGTDRVRAAVGKLNLSDEIVVNIQGDEPLLDGTILDKLVDAFGDKQVEMATLGASLTLESLQSPNTAKILLDHADHALYFTRLPAPFSRISPEAAPREAWNSALKHIGMYAFRIPFLERFCNQRPTWLEQLEGLEQLRALYLGAKIKVVRVQDESWSVDTPGDVAKIETILRSRGEKNA